MGVMWNPANREFYRSQEISARNLILTTQGACGSMKRVGDAGQNGRNYYVDAYGVVQNGGPTAGGSGGTGGDTSTVASDPESSDARFSMGIVEAKIEINAGLRELEERMGIPRWLRRY